MIKLFQVALLLIVMNVTFASKYQACDVHKLDCPPNSICSQIGNDEKGQCKCPPHMELNPLTIGPSDYCIQDGNSISDASAMSSSGRKEKTVVHIQPPPESHHVIVGILVPMILVLVIIGAAYGIRKFHPVRRLREYVISRRRNRPLYEDVMMTQELDDPTLM